MLKRLHHLWFAFAALFLFQGTALAQANAIETFKVRPRQEGFMSTEIRALFPELGPTPA